MSKVFQNVEPAVSSLCFEVCINKIVPAIVLTESMKVYLNNNSISITFHVLLDGWEGKREALIGIDTVTVSHWKMFVAFYWKLVEKWLSLGNYDEI